MRFLEHRSGEREHFDNASNSEGVEFHRELRRLNRLFQFARPFQLYMPKLVGEEGCRNLNLLDVGAGTGELGEELEEWAAGRGWKWRATAIDLKETGLAMGSRERRVVGSAGALPFGDGSFDWVIASQMTHHLSREEEVVAHFREAWRVARMGVLISDLYRHPAVYVMVGLVGWLAGCSRRLREDGMTSVARGFVPPEWKRLAAEAGMRGAEVWIYFRSRIILAARKGEFV